MRISDWSSDVCSSDLGTARAQQHAGGYANAACRNAGGSRSNWQTRSNQASGLAAFGYCPGNAGQAGARATGKYDKARDRKNGNYGTGQNFTARGEMAWSARGLQRSIQREIALGKIVKQRDGTGRLSTLSGEGKGSDSAMG